MEKEGRAPGAAASESNGNRCQGDREALRVRHGVRLVAPEEEGFALDRLPSGVYGFTCAPGQDEIPVFSRQSLRAFEAHKDTDGIEYIIGFVTPEQADDIASGDAAEVTLFPEEWGAARQIVAVALTRMASHKRALTRDEGNPLKFTLV
jgi:hypothetical protein